MDIQSMRNEIDAIDKELVKLFCDRMEVTARIGAYKRENSLPVLDSERERALLDKVANAAGEPFSASARVLYTTIMELSRAYQHRLSGESTPLAEQMKLALENTEKLFPERAVVACQGVPGAYSQMACEKLFAAPSIMYFSSFEGVFQAVEKGLCRYGVLPIENSTAGSVNRIYDLMDQFKSYIVRGARLQISHTLLGKRGTALSDIREIVSHEQALAQCGDFLRAHPDIKVTECENTAMAARLVAQSERSDIAAISSSACAELYSLSVINGNVCDNIGNYTRFICISKSLEIYPGANRTSLIMRLPHRAGSLHRVISRFYALGINLEKLESRPKPGSDFEFVFYFDIGASVYSPALFELICELTSELPDFRYLGSYSELT